MSDSEEINKALTESTHFKLGQWVVIEDVAFKIQEFTEVANGTSKVKLVSALELAMEPRTGFARKRKL